MVTIQKLNQEKATEAASIFLKLHNGEMKYLLLVKLLYFLEREAYKHWERPVIFDTYSSLPYGPIVSETLDLIKGKKMDSEFWDNYIVKVPDKKVKLKDKDNPPKIKKLSPAEIGLISEIDAKYGGYDPFELAQKMHDLPEYKHPGRSSLPITLEDLLSAVGYDSEDIHRILCEMQEEANIDLVFSL